MPILVTRLNNKGYVINVLYNDLNTCISLAKSIGKNIWELTPTCQGQGQSEHHFNKVLVSAQKQVFQMHSRTHDYHISYLPEFDNNGNIVTVLSVFRDITKEQKKKNNLELNQAKLKMASQELTQQLQQANALIQANQVRVGMAAQLAKVGYFEWDVINDKLDFSDQQYRNLGYLPKAFIPTVPFMEKLIHPDDLDKLKAQIGVITTEKYAELQVRIVKADGEEGWLNFRSNATTDEQDHLVRIFGITQDITAQKQTEKLIKRVEKELGFANQISSRGAYLNKWIVKDYPLEQVLVALNEFGIETKRAHCCFVVQLSEKSAFAADIPDNTVSARMAKKQEVLIWLAENELGWIWRFNDDIVLLIPLPETNIISKQSQLEFGLCLHGKIEKLVPHVSVWIGISGTSSIPLNLKESYEKANQAAIVAAAVNEAAVVHFDDIGIYDVAFQLLNDKSTCNMVQSTIGRLAEYDQARRSNLLLTLDYILADMSLKTIARKLFIHHNTAIWRKRRIEVLLGMSLDKLETKALLILYRKIWSLQKNNAK
jgi:PAS domain S-box-containing protein